MFEERSTLVVIKYLIHTFAKCDLYSFRNFGTYGDVENLNGKNTKNVRILRAHVTLNILKGFECVAIYIDYI